MPVYGSSDPRWAGDAYLSASCGRRSTGPCPATPPPVIVHILHLQFEAAAPTICDKYVAAAPAGRADQLVSPLPMDPVSMVCELLKHIDWGSLSFTCLIAYIKPATQAATKAERNDQGLKRRKEPISIPIDIDFIVNIMGTLRGSS